MCNAHNHPPGCTCGWGGYGSRGGNYGFGQVFSNWKPDIKNSLSDFCAEVNCRDCGQSTFLIHHNGGYVLVDELGWPWPIHACYERKHSECHYNLSDVEVCFFEDFVRFKKYENLILNKSRVEFFLVIKKIIWGQGEYLLLTDLKGKQNYEIFVDNESKPFYGRILGISKENQLIVTPFRKPIKYHSILNDHSSLPNYEEIDLSVRPKLHKIIDYESVRLTYYGRRKRTVYDEKLYVEIRLKNPNSDLPHSTNEKVIIAVKFLQDVIEIDDKESECRFLTKIRRDIILNNRKEIKEDHQRLLWKKSMGLISEKTFKAKLQLTSSKNIKFSKDFKQIEFIGI